MKCRTAVQGVATCIQNGRNCCCRGVVDQSGSWLWCCSCHTIWGIVTGLLWWRRTLSATHVATLCAVIATVGIVAATVVVAAVVILKLCWWHCCMIVGNLLWLCRICHRTTCNSNSNSNAMLLASLQLLLLLWCCCIEAASGCCCCPICGKSHRGCSNQLPRMAKWQICR